MTSAGMLSGPGAFFYVTEMFGLATPAKCVICPNFYKGVFFGEPSFTESSYVNALSFKLTGNERGATPSSLPNVLWSSHIPANDNDWPLSY